MMMVMMAVMIIDDDDDDDSDNYIYSNNGDGSDDDDDDDDAQYHNCNYHKYCQWYIIFGNINTSVYSTPASTIEVIVIITFDKIVFI